MKHELELAALAAVDVRWDELVAASEHGGVPATHCCGPACFGPHGSLCECECAPCEVADALHEQAELEATVASRSAPTARGRGAGGTP